MRHQYAGNKLGMQPSHRKATVRDIAKATLIRQRICTTKARAKEARKVVEKLITFGKKGTLAHKRMAFSVLCDHGLVSDLFDKIAPRFKDRQGGYTRIIAISAPRRGDNASMVYLELTEKEIVVVSKPKAVSKSKDKTIDVTPEQKGAASATEVLPETEKKSTKPGQSKSGTPKHTPEQGKSKPKLGGGIRKMFQRKTGAE